MNCANFYIQFLIPEYVNTSYLKLTQFIPHACCFVDNLNTITVFVEK